MYRTIEISLGERLDVSLGCMLSQIVEISCQGKLYKIWKKWSSFFSEAAVPKLLHSSCCSKIMYKVNDKKNILLIIFKVTDPETRTTSIDGVLLSLLWNIKGFLDLILWFCFWLLPCAFWSVIYPKM